MQIPPSHLTELVNTLTASLEATLHKAMEEAVQDVAASATVIVQTITTVVEAKPTEVGTTCAQLESLAAQDSNSRCVVTIIRLVYCDKCGWDGREI